MKLVLKVNQVLMDKTVKMVNMEKTVNQVDLAALVQPVPAVLSVLQEHVGYQSYIFESERLELDHKLSIKFDGQLITFFFKASKSV